ncbi:Transposase [Thalassovita gelatinovora]|uniref:Transposase n=1 Tax=Thalassovita gelatinovora TaxID=53501 RepID=A0A0P1G3P7_THAGE|nr:Transposase [Thalassovita gelatinovora]SEP74871.1 hypothetical protein SAMN04488043_101276 [Thalassovita gelatinovora]
MSDLFWLSDAQMARLEPYFPKSHGKPRVRCPAGDCEAICREGRPARSEWDYLHKPQRLTLA